MFLRLFSRRTLLWTLLVLLGATSWGMAQSRLSFETHPTEVSVSIDGSLDEPTWQQVTPVTGFKQYEPNEGQSASQKTEAYVLYGPSHLYVGARLYDNEPAKIRQVLGRRDDYNQADWFTVSIDSYFNQKTAYTFAVNAAGVQYDAIQMGEENGPGPGGPNRGPGDESWDAIWTSEVDVTDQGWVVEMRIPYSMLRFSEGQETWGIHFMRYTPRLGEQVEWPLVQRTQRSNLVANFALLEGLEGIDPKRNVQVRPYTVSRLETHEAPQQPGTMQSSTALDVGGDLKVGLSSNMTLDATINPDFGQVEADPAVLNLTAFETFYEEKRPFFLEGAQIYEFSVGPGQLLYTRRIGAQAPIIGASKLSGRTSNGLSIGVLGAATGRHFDPNRSYGAVRLSQQIGSFSSVGGILTGFEGPASEGRKRSLTGGTDWDLRLPGNTYGVEGFAAFTHQDGSVSGFDTQTGFASKVWARKRQGTWKGFVGVDVFNDKFNPNDVGQLRRNNFIALLKGLDYEINGGQSFGRFQRAALNGFAIQRFSYRQGHDLGLSYNLRSTWMLKSFQQIGVNLGVENPFGGYDLYETRGLGPWAKPFMVELEAEIETDERRSWEVEPEAGLTMTENGSHAYMVGFRGNWDVGARLTLSGNIEAEWENDKIAWASNESFIRQDNGWMIGTESTSPARLKADDYKPFDDQGRLAPILSDMSPFGASGQYYVPVFGTRDTRSLDFTARSNITFTTDLSLQFYGQVFVARGQYRDFQILKDPNTLEPFEAYPKQDAFAISSFQANTVLRWEYRPGSTVYLVWSQGRRANYRVNPLAPRQRSPYKVPTSERLLKTFSIFPQNTFLVKFDYTFLN